MRIFLFFLLLGAALELGRQFMGVLINSIFAYLRKPDIEKDKIMLDKQFCKWVARRYPITDHNFKGGDRKSSAIWAMMADAYANGKRDGKDGN